MLKFIKISELVIPHQTLFQYQLGFVYHLTLKVLHTKCDKRQYVTTVFELLQTQNL